MKVCTECNRIVSEDTTECECGCTEFQVLLFREEE